MDKKLEMYLNNNAIQVPFKRLESQQYLFGTKKINVVIRNGVLMVRVGGGFMSIQEFVDKHSEKEMQSLKIKVKKEGKDYETIVKDMAKMFNSKKFGQKK